jgi:hypothetical protein
MKHARQRWKRTGVIWMALAAVPGLARNGTGAAAPAGGAGERARAAETVRAVGDPATGDCWLLERHNGHSGGPGRWLRTARGDAACGKAGGAPEASRMRAGERAGEPVIRAGERIVVEAKTPVFQARLEAVALEPGWPGAVLRVRLPGRGSVLHAVALGPGRARLLPERGGWR